MRILELAREAQTYFKVDTHELDTNAPDWIKKIYTKAIGNFGNDNYRNKYICEILGSIAAFQGFFDPYEINTSSDKCKTDLFAWLSSHAARAEYCNQAIEDSMRGMRDYDGDWIDNIPRYNNIYDIIAGGQYFEKKEIRDSLLDSLGYDEDEE